MRDLRDLEGKKMSCKLNYGLAWAVLAVAIQVAGLVCFIYGFFPVKSTLPGFSGIESYEADCHTVSEVSEDLPPDQLRSLFAEKSGLPIQFDRLIFMVIDGLPAEFVLGKGEGPPARMYREAMPYTHSLLSSGKAIGYHAKAAPPTVTMPRLKAMTSGAIAGFLDVAFNFHTQALLDDNILYQLARIGWRIVMLGDNTWLKLFPNFFLREDGVSSFYVKDTIEVDRNVSRHLDYEVNSADWDLLILHYLGLDHVGHIGGRESSLMAPKLSEMDEIIKKLHLSLVNNLNPMKQRSLLMIVSDHGMTKGGNHGGSSFEETDALAIFVPYNFSPAHDTTSMDTYSAFQVDIVPTLALLLGVPIPKNNIGVLLPQLFWTMRDDYILRALELNSWQIMKLLHKRFPSSKCISSVCYAKTPPDILEKNSSNEAMDVKLCLLLQRAILLHYCLKNTSPVDLGEECAHNRNADISKKAYIEFLRSASEFLARGNTEKPLLFIVFGGALMLVSLVMLFTIILLTGSESCGTGEIIKQSTGSQIHVGTLEKIIAVFGICLHAFSLGSSSLVEEEQYVWYFLISSLWVAFVFRIYHSWGLQDSESIGFFWSHHNLFLGDIGNINFSGCNNLKRILAIAVVIFGGRVLRGWHQGGVNWTFLPDIAKWLDSSGQSITKTLHIVSVLCLIAIATLCFLGMNVYKWLKVFVISNILVAGASVILFILSQGDKMAMVSKNLPLITARVVYSFLGMTALITLTLCPWIIPLSNCDILDIHQCQKSDPHVQHVCSRKANICIQSATRTCIFCVGMTFVFCWCLLQLLLQQPTNAFPVVILLLQLLSITNYFYYSAMQHRAWIMVITLYCLGMSGHFSLGNSNNLATVDVAGAYIGLSKHSTVISGILAFMITYASPLLFLFGLSLPSSYMSYRQGVYSHADSGNPQYLCLRIITGPYLLPLCLNSVVLFTFSIILYSMKDHLFVWSVFSPKYLYVCATTVCVYVATIINSFIAFYCNAVTMTRVHHMHLSTCKL